MISERVQRVSDELRCLVEQWDDNPIGSSKWTEAEQKLRGGAIMRRLRSVLAEEASDRAAIQRLTAENAELRAALATARCALELHEAWEAHIIMRADWDTADGLPHLTQRQMDALAEVQDARNTAMTSICALAPDTAEDER